MRLAVDYHRAGAADSFAAAVFGSSEREIRSQHPQEHPLIISLKTNRLAIERERHSLFHRKNLCDWIPLSLILRKGIEEIQFSRSLPSAGGSGSYEPASNSGRSRRMVLGARPFHRVPQVDLDQQPHCSTRHVHHHDPRYLGTYDLLGVVL